LPAGWPRLFFCDTLLFFSAAVISDAVLGVFDDTRFDGRQYGVPRFSPFWRPHSLPVRTSFQSSLNQRLRAAPFLVLRTATSFLLPAFGDGARCVGRGKHLILPLHLAVAIVLHRSAFLVVAAHYAPFILIMRALPLPRWALPQPRTAPPFFMPSPCRRRIRSPDMASRTPRAAVSRSVLARSL